MKNKFYKYALLLLKRGLCIKEGQPLVINVSVDAIEFVRVLTDVACSLGVKDIYYDFYDDELKYTELKYFDEASIKNSRFWNKSIYNEYVNKNSAFLFLISPSCIDMDDIDSKNLIASHKISLESRSIYFNKQENNKLSWCIASVASKKWANLIFKNNLCEIDKLWDIIFDICLVNTSDPIREWDKKIEYNKSICNKFNDLKIKKLIYSNSLGTNIEIELDENAIWCGGASNINGDTLIVNIPTEEVFTTPNKYKTKGSIYTKTPLIHQGIEINDIYLKFENGHVIDFSSSSGYDELKNIIETDNESSMLGEVALVSKDSKINKSGIIFHETLFDENASCHIALGRGFKECYSDNAEDESVLDDRGYNKSSNHVDIMIGTDDMKIIAETYDNKKIVIFYKGNYLI